MFEEERIINGVLHYRTTPSGDWIKYTPEQITEKHKRLKEDSYAQNERAYINGKKYEQERIANLFGLGLIFNLKKDDE